jgi:hypothetical protein
MKSYERIVEHLEGRRLFSDVAGSGGAGGLVPVDGGLGTTIFDVRAEGAVTAAFVGKLPRSLNPGQAGRVVVRFTNTGSGPATVSLQPAIYFSGDTLLDSADLRVRDAGAVTGTLLPGRSRNVVFNFRAPVTVSSPVIDGNYYVLAADAGGAVLAGSDATVHLVTPFVNLVPTFAGRPGVRRGTRDVAFALRVRNTGNTAASGTMNVALSLRPAAGGADVALPSIDGLAVSVGAKRAGVVRHTVTLPAGVGAGRYSLVAMIVPDPADSNGGDNGAVSGVFVVRG